jgi:hypothetical protein
MIRQYEDVPNVAFRRLVQQYAFEYKKPVFTMKEEQAALENYIHFAITRN